jgi:hypothetical protein
MNRVRLISRGFSAFENFDADVDINRLRKALQRILKYQPKRV